MSKKEMFAFGKKLRGSILAYSLIIISIMLAIAGTLSAVSIIEKKGSSGTEFSMQALQTADSGVQLALKKIKGKAGSVFSIWGPACLGGKITGTDAGPTGSTYELTLFNSSGTQLTCADNVNTVSDVKSVGTYKSTVRAVSVSVGTALAAGGGAPSGWACNVVSGTPAAYCAVGEVPISSGCAAGATGFPLMSAPNQFGFSCSAGAAASVLCCK